MRGPKMRAPEELTLTVADAEPGELWFTGMSSHCVHVEVR